MAITFNNIPTTIRTPGAYVEVDNSRALQGLLQNPHKVLVIGQMKEVGTAAGTAALNTIKSITNDTVADGFFGIGSVLARMCNTFKDNNPNTELHAMAVGVTGGVAASGSISFSNALIDDTVTNNHTWKLMINGIAVDLPVNSGDDGADIGVRLTALLQDISHIPIQTTTAAGIFIMSAKISGTLGNYINVRDNYYLGEEIPSCFSGDPITSHYVSLAGGTTDPDLGDVWAVIGGEQYHYIIQPYIDAANLTEIEDELADRFLPLEDLQGHGFTSVRGTQASCTTLGNTRNSPHNTIVGMYDSPTCPEEIAAAWGAVAAYNLNIDPARPLQTLSLKGVLPPPIENRFTRAERDILLYDGIATYTVDNGGKVLIERSITTYQTNAYDILDPSYLDVQTLATLSEIRYQYKARMILRFIATRYKLADDTFPVQPGSYVATPKTVKQETIALFTLLRDRGLIENLDDFVDNLVVERDISDVNRVNVLLPPDLINQFRILAGNIQFLL